MAATTIGIDLAKSVFHIYGIDETGKVTVNRRLSRGQLTRLLAGADWYGGGQRGALLGTATFQLRP